MIDRDAVSTRRADADRRWRAVLARDPALDTGFVYAVVTTGIYCRPACPSRRPHRRNVDFFADAATAAQAGYRACKRCHPDRPTDQPTAMIAQACNLIATAEQPPALTELAARAGLSPSHFHRTFRKITGVTPGDYAAHVRAQRIRRSLGTAQTTTEAIYDAGFRAPSRFYAASREMLGMTVETYRRGGQKMRIMSAAARCSLGIVLVAATDQGVCAVLIGDDAVELDADLERRFPKAVHATANADMERLVAGVVAAIDVPSRAQDLPLDIRGTAFELRVWQALRAIPPGQTRSYGDVAAAIGAPRSARAVARACGANPLAVVVPCHRVVGAGGALTGYRWGLERKRQLLEREEADARRQAAARPARNRRRAPKP